MPQPNNPKVPHARRFRWRTIPAGIIGAIGLIVACMGLFMAFAIGYAMATGRQLYIPGPDDSPESITATTWAIVGGAWLMCSAWLWWKGRWRWAIAMVAIYVGATELAKTFEIIPD